MKDDLGARRRALRERMRAGNQPKQWPDPPPGWGWYFAGALVLGGLLGTAGHLPIATWLDGLLCTPTQCPHLPLALTGWAFAVLPATFVYVAAIKLVPHRLVNTAFIVFTGVSTFMFTLFATPNEEVPRDVDPVPHLWVFPLTYFVYTLLIVPASVGLAAVVVRTGDSEKSIAQRKLLVFGLVNYVLLAVLVVWLA